MENNWAPTHARYSTVQILSNKQGAKVICRFKRLRTSHSKRQKSHWALKRLTSTHTFNYIWCSSLIGLTSCEDLAMALHRKAITMVYKCICFMCARIVVWAHHNIVDNNWVFICIQYCWSIHSQLTPRRKFII